MHDMIPVPEHGIPASVLTKAWQLGLHNDCLAAGADAACQFCLENVFLAFDFIVGDDKTVPEIIGAITGEFLEEERARIDGR